MALWSRISDAQVRFSVGPNPGKVFDPCFSKSRPLLQIEIEIEASGEIFDMQDAKGSEGAVSSSVDNFVRLKERGQLQLDGD